MTATAPLSASQDALLTAVAAARASLDAAAEGVGWTTSGEAVLDGIRELSRLRGQVEAVHLALVRELDARGLATSAPVATSPEGFLRTTCLVGAGQARRDVAAARATAPGRPLEALATDLAAGDSTRAHLDVGVRCLDRVPAALLARPGASTVLVDYLRTAAHGASPLDMDRAARQLLARLDPDGEGRRDGFDPDAHARRFLDVHTDGTGMVVGSFQLDPVAGATFRAALETCSAPTAGADGEPDRRQPRERRADALAAIAGTALGVAVPRRGERPRVVVHVTPEQLAAPGRRSPGLAPPPGLAAPPGPGASPGLTPGRGGNGTQGSQPASPGLGLAILEGGEPVLPGTLRRLACDAVLQRVLETPSLGPLDVGREHRLVTLAQRRALEARDGGCVIPGCCVPPAQCDAHHVVHWADGGPSDLTNYVLVCPGHHTAVHAGSWEVSVSGGEVLVTPPRRVDPTRTPRPPQRHAVRRALAALTRPAVADGEAAGGGTDPGARGPAPAASAANPWEAVRPGAGGGPDDGAVNLFGEAPAWTPTPREVPDLPDDIFLPLTRTSPRSFGSLFRRMEAEPSRAGP